MEVGSVAVEISNSNVVCSTLVDLLCARAAHHPKRCAYKFLIDGEIEETQLTYGELDRRARAIAATLQSIRATGERALLLYPPGLEYIASLFGCLYAGVVAVPMYPPKLNRPVDRGLPRLQAIVEDARPLIALTTSSILSMAGSFFPRSLGLESERWVATDMVSDDLAEEWRAPRLNSSSLAFLQYTSGSTATPKGVMVSHGNLLYNEQMIKAAFDDTETSTFVSWLPLYHDMGLIGNVLQSLYIGASAILMSPLDFLLRPFCWLQAISRYQAHTSGAPNFAYDLCVRKVTPEQRATLDLSSWQIAFNGSEPVRPQTLERFATTFESCGFRREAFYPCYGLAEATVFVSGGLKLAPPVLCSVQASALEQNRVVAATDKDEDSRLLVGCGRTWYDQEIVIVHPASATLCGPDQVGEIWVAGPHIAQGYWNNPEETKQTFQAYLSDPARGLFLRTGDLGFLKEGELFIVSRIKDLIIIRGRNHYPQDIELTVEQSHLALQPGSGAAFSIEVAGEERLVIVQGIKRTQRNADVNEITLAIRQAVAENHELEVYAIVLVQPSTVPKTSSGKIQRHLCRNNFLKGTLSIVGEWVQSPDVEPAMSLAKDRADPSGQMQSAQAVQAWIVSHLSRQLGIEPQAIDVGKSFASLGLSSMQAVSLLADLECWLGRRLPSTLAWDYPTIKILSQYLGSETISQDSVGAGCKTEVEPIAIIGIGCRFPGANNVEAFWKLLCEGQDAITEIPPNRWAGDAFYDPDPMTKGKANTRWGGFVDQVDQFDPYFFGIAPREAACMDPQQRLLLQVAWQALENAGQAADQLAGSQSGVFVGISSNDYAHFQLSSPVLVDAYAGTGNAHSIAANRLSFLLGLCGPSLAVDTACSSSLVAVHLACQSLRQGECDLALAGGVNVILAPQLTIAFSQMHLMAADGRCKTFDADADGYVRGEGCGLVVLKRLSQAMADGDHVWAVLRGSAINHDGPSNGLTAPSGLAQQAVIRRALQNAAVAPSQISYIEAHGTGTPLGDPIEFNALKTVLMEGRAQNQLCALGSVKTNIGHLEAAAGIAGLIKATLSLYHGVVPPHLHFKKLNPHISLENVPLFIPTERRPWPETMGHRLAGVSSFGFGGANAHVVLEQRPAAEPSGPSRPVQLLMLSTKTRPALDQATDNLAAYLKQQPDLDLADVAYTLQTGRSTFNCRRVVICQDTRDAVTVLEGLDPQRVLSGQAQSANRPVTFMFPGMGDQYVNVASGLYQSEPVFRHWVDECCALLQLHLGLDLHDLMYPKETSQPIHPARPEIDLRQMLRCAPSIESSQIGQTSLAHSILFTVEYALAQLWMSWGIKPSTMIGYSIGEYVAACLAGVFSLEDGLRIVIQRANLAEGLPEGAMLAVALPEESLVPLLNQALSLCASNGAQMCVVGGPLENIAELERQLATQGVACRRLQASRAFHSKMMEPITEAIRELMQTIKLKPLLIPYISNVTGTWITSEQATDPSYWTTHMCQPVRFAAGIQALWEKPDNILLEVGIGQTLGGLALQHPAREKATDPLVLFSLPAAYDKRSDLMLMLQSLGQLWLAGLAVDWPSFYAHERRRYCSLPTFPFEEQRCWFEYAAPRVAPAALPAMECASAKKDIAEWFYVPTWQRRPLTRSNQQAAEKRFWLFFVDEQGLGQALAERQQQQGEDVTVVMIGTSLQRVREGVYTLNPRSSDDYLGLIRHLVQMHKPPNRIVHLWNVTTKGNDSIEAMVDHVQQFGFYSLLFLAQALGLQADAKPVQMWVISNEMQDVLGDEVICPEKAALLGPCKVIPTEYEHITCSSVDVVLSQGRSKNLVELLLTEFAAGVTDKVVAYRTQYRWVQSFEGIRLSDTTGGLARLRTNGVYLITGGLGGLGLALAEQLASIAQAKLILVGRSGLPPRSEWPAWLASHKSDDERTHRQIQQVLTLEDLGAEVLIAAADVSDLAQMRLVLDQTHKQFGRVNGVFHLAGVPGAGLIQLKTPDMAEQVMAPKLKGTLVLAVAVQDEPLDFMVLYSSVYAVAGGLGEVDYCAANAFLDAFTHYHRRRRSVLTFSVNWGPWEWDPWQSTLLSPIPQLARRVEQLRQEYGISMTGGVEALWRILAAELPQVLVLPQDWDSFVDQWLSLTPSSLQERILEGGPASGPISPSHRPALMTTYIAPTNKMEERIAEVWQDCLGITPIGIHDNFFQLGGHSLTATQVQARLQEVVGVLLPLRLVLVNPTISELAVAVEMTLIEKLESLTEEQAQSLM